MLPVIVLVSPSHPGNIGAVARAMKVMNHYELRLVNPKQFPDETANARASNAVDILKQAICYDNLESAVADCNIVLATSNRPRTLSWPVYTPNEAVTKFKSANQKIAVVFGRESTGLTNEELNICHAQVSIPTNDDYKSLNLSHAVQIITYSFFNSKVNNNSKQLAQSTHTENMQLRDHLNKTIKNLPFFNMPNPKHTLNRLFCLINRAQPSKNELNLLHGILSAVDKVLSKNQE